MIEEASPDQETLQRQVKQATARYPGRFHCRKGTGRVRGLTKTLVERVVMMQHIVGHIEPLIPKMVEQFKQKAIERMQEALGVAIEGGVPATMTQQEAVERIRQEVTLYGMRIECCRRTVPPENPSG